MFDNTGELSPISEAGGSSCAKPFRIGSVDINPNLILAPMSGVTNSAFRRLIRLLNPNGVGLVVSEFISVEGLTRQNAQSLRMMQFRNEERPVSIQIFGSEISRMTDAARMVQDAGADIVDINCGCPVPKVVKKGGGCELMRHPDHLRSILESVRRAVSIPLTVKIRAGWDSRSINCLEIAQMAEDVGVDMIAVHGRTRQDLYRGRADWNLVGEIARALRIPVVGSGDIVDGASFARALSCGVSGVMVGRGALLNPWIFGEMLAGSSSRIRSDRRPSDEVYDVLRLYTRILREDLPDKAVLGRLKQLSSQVTRLIPHSATLRRELCCSHSVVEYLERLDRAPEILARSVEGVDFHPDPADEERTVDAGAGIREIEAERTREEEPYGEGYC